jgi:hypothetical protein
VPATPGNLEREDVVTTTDTRRLEYVPLDDLQPAARNPKRHDLPAIGRSIDTFGYVEPVVLDERTGRLVAGHGRVEQLRAARDGGGVGAGWADGRPGRGVAGAGAARVGVGV